MDQRWPEPYSNGNGSVPSSTFSNRLPNHQTVLKPVINSKLLLTVTSIIGIPSYIGALLLNISTWKGDLLFILACAYWLFKFCRLVWKGIQDIREREIELKAKKRRYEQEN